MVDQGFEIRRRVLRGFNPNYMPENRMKQILLIAMTKYSQCQRWFGTLGTDSYLTNLTDSYDEMTGSAGERGQQ